MSKSNGLFLSLILLFVVSSSVSSPRSLVFGSPVPEQRYNRPDPLSHFKYYNGDYDVRNKHYWASAAFTGVHGYAIAGIWILCGLGFGTFMIVKNLSSSSSPITGHSDSYYFIPLLLVVLFTSLVIVATSFVLATNQSSLWRTKKLKETLLGAVQDARRTIRKVTRVMKEMHHLLRPYDPRICFRLNSTSHKLEKESKIIQQVVHKNQHSIDHAIQTSYLVTVVVVSINVALVLAALVLLLLHYRPGFIMIIFLCWVLTALCWVLTGFHFFLHTFAEDTCSAFEEFERNPTNNSLSSMLPCVDQVYADQIMVEIGSTIHNFINELNLKITMLSRLFELDEHGEDLLSGIRKICDPFSGAPDYLYSPSKCPKDAIPIGDIPNVLARFTCYRDNSTGTCKGGRSFLSEASFEMAWAYTHSIQGLLNVLPDLQSLTQCSFVKDTLANVVTHQCRPFRVSIRLLWSSMLSLSVIMLVLVLAWVAKSYQDRG
ncbi:hypothetical protein HHK36_002755 [Tetracentron sinense]|uniref:Uncharacterized protein n=1 Tax=Tetracentron sinense TaxID=13715 RepID=A0A834ZQ09_TETSI|nr:hypothetical protein HHK36_002755 [Tetracentron sinense]